VLPYAKAFAETRVPAFELVTAWTCYVQPQPLLLSSSPPQHNTQWFSHFQSWFGNRTNS